MENNTLNLLLSELTASTSYLERVFMAIEEVPSLMNDLEIEDEYQEFFLDYCHFIEDNLFLPQFRRQKDREFNIHKISASFRDSNQMVLNFLKFMPEEEFVIEFSVAYINLIYEYAHSLHMRCDDLCEIEILFPRTSLALSNTDDFTLPKFYLSQDTIYNFKDQKLAQLESLEWKRKNKYDTLISEGHKEVFDKNHDKALELFCRANSFIETAESLTLIGWIHSILGDLEKAKSSCVKAIKVDPDYGPPYNDIGSYLLSENKVNDALKWFALAKKAAVYQNREYPYINSGRAYLGQKKNKLALEEFSKALTLAPYHTELHDTVTKLKESLESKNNDEKSLFSNLHNIGLGHDYDHSSFPSHEWT